MVLSDGQSPRDQLGLEVVAETTHVLIRVIISRRLVRA